METSKASVNYTRGNSISTGDHLFPPDEVHNFYQDVFITDMKREMSQVSNEANLYKVEAGENAINLKKLQKENSTMKKVVKRYREIIGT